ncbi:MAG TPA: 50S ribosomal protein L23 [Terrimicrobium sp.]
MKASFDQIQTVILTEKATLLSEKNNQYVFRVSPKANKIEIKRAVEDLFKKTVVHVNTANFTGKKKRERTANFGRRANWKKAVVTLKEGDKIELV